MYDIDIIILLSEGRVYTFSEKNVHHPIDYIRIQERKIKKQNKMLVLTLFREWRKKSISSTFKYFNVIMTIKTLIK